MRNRSQQQKHTHDGSPIIEFYAAIINEAELERTKSCPICDDVQSGFIKMKDIDTEGDTNSLSNLMIGEILACNNCGCVIISIQFPVMELTSPVYLDWKVNKLINPAEATNSGEAKYTIVTTSSAD